MCSVSSASRPARRVRCTFTPATFPASSISRRRSSTARTRNCRRPTFPDGRPAMSIFLIGGKPRFAKSLISFRPRVGDFYIFPGWLLHGARTLSRHRRTALARVQRLCGRPVAPPAFEHFAFGCQVAPARRPRPAPRTAAWPGWSLVRGLQYSYRPICGEPEVVGSMQASAAYKEAIDRAALMLLAALAATTPSRSIRRFSWKRCGCAAA